MLILSMLRGKTLLILAMVMLIPSAIATVFSLTPILFKDHSQLLVEAYRYHPVTILNPSSGEDCVLVKINEVTIYSGNYSWQTQIYVVEDLAKFLNITGVRIVNKIASSAQRYYSIGIRLSKELRVRAGSCILLCIRGSCLNKTVNLVHKGDDVFNYILVTNDVDAYRNGYESYVCRREENIVVEETIEALNNEIASTMTVLAIIVIASYVLILYLALAKVTGLLGKTFESLYNLGIPLITLKVSFVLSSIIVGLILMVYGIAFGVFTVHLSTWLLRFINVVIVSRPIPSIDNFIILTLIAVLEVFVTSIIASRRLMYLYSMDKNSG